MVDTAPKADFTLDELLAYLGQQEDLGDEFKTSKEWATYFRMDLKRVMGILHRADEAGILMVGREIRLRIDGVKQPVPVYAFDLRQNDEDPGR